MLERAKQESTDIKEHKECGNIYRYPRCFWPIDQRNWRQVLNDNPFRDILDDFPLVMVLHSSNIDFIGVSVNG